ncbi:hypothetical protein DVH24_021332 [Malus domestica]|uniref:Uncharacterized protein n=1 Tax=Malus domestica TaxID=3750 RepID=A0A498JVW5_MALDO|nr:hypothetical protein DVH24_021332 [Malus domestica]
MVTSAMKGKAWTRKEDEAICRAYRWVSEDSVNSVWTRTSKKYYEFYGGTTPPNPRNYYEISVFTNTPSGGIGGCYFNIHLKKDLILSKICTTNYIPTRGTRNPISCFKVHQAEELYMEDMKKRFTHHGCWEICKGWVLFQHPPQERLDPI